MFREVIDIQERTSRPSQRDSTNSRGRKKGNVKSLVLAALSNLECGPPHFGYLSMTELEGCTGGVKVVRYASMLSVTGIVVSYR